MLFVEFEPLCQKLWAFLLNFGSFYDSRSLNIMIWLVLDSWSHRRRYCVVWEVCWGCVSQLANVSCHWFQFSAAILLIGSTVRSHKRDSLCFCIIAEYLVDTMFDDALKFLLPVKKWPTKFRLSMCVNPFILLFEAVILLHGGIFYQVFR